MRVTHCILFINLCIAQTSAGTDNKNLLEAEALEKKLLHAEDILMMEHLKEQGFTVYPNKTPSSTNNTY
ncbi:hypothetical protein KMI_05g08010 [Encephalitozoon hellem]|nr:hypothetical protein KMI_05g08010 [Encephalitozoon hellem]